MWSSSSGTVPECLFTSAQPHWLHLCPASSIKYALIVLEAPVRTVPDSLPSNHALMYRSCLYLVAHFCVQNLFLQAALHLSQVFFNSLTLLGYRVLLRIDAQDLEQKSFAVLRTCAGHLSKTFSQLAHVTSIMLINVVRLFKRAQWDSNPYHHFRRVVFYPVIPCAHLYRGAQSI